MGSQTKKDVIADDGVVLEDRLQGKSLENVHTSFVKPSSATPGEKEWLFLSKLDLIWIPYYTPILCTFTLTEHKFGSVDLLVEHLKDSLADTLVLFYPLAGRVVTDDGPPRIHCNDAGAVFTEASVDVELADLRTDDFQPQPLLSGASAAGLGTYPALPRMEGGRPALIIQVTHFKCGGITLAANWAHGVADGQSGLHFMKSWSELARGLQVSLLPDHRRDLVKVRDSLVITNPVKSLAVSAGAQTVPSEKNDDDSGLVDKPGEGKPEVGNSAEAGTKTEQRKIMPKIVEFKEDEIAKLKKQALDHDASVQLSRADCMSAHLWRTMARARSLPASALVRLIVLVEGRKKLSLPTGYFGNVIGIVVVTSTVSEVVNGPFGSTASLIHSGISSTTAEWFQNLIDFMHVKPPGQRLHSERLGPGCEMGVSYLVRFPFYELDFGFGRPAHSTRNTMGAWDGLIFVVPSSHSPNHMVAMANLDSTVMSRFVSMAHDIPQTDGAKLRDHSLEQGV